MFYCRLSACGRADERSCLRFGISGKTGYKWLSRYRDFGAAGLIALSSARHTVGPAIDPAIADAVVALRNQRPTARHCAVDPHGLVPSGALQISAGQETRSLLGARKLLQSKRVDG